VQRVEGGGRPALEREPAVAANPQQIQRERDVEPRPLTGARDPDKPV